MAWSTEVETPPGGCVLGHAVALWVCVRRGLDVDLCDRRKRDSEACGASHTPFSQASVTGMSGYQNGGHYRFMTALFHIDHMGFAAVPAGPPVLPAMGDPEYSRFSCVFPDGRAPSQKTDTKYQKPARFSALLRDGGGRTGARRKQERSI
jgi:hypothetical protein